MKVFCCLIAIVSLVSFNGSAQQNRAESPNVLVSLSKASEELKNKLAKLNTFEASFQQSVIDGQGELLQESKGKLFLKQPNLMLWRVDEPDENKLIADGETLWFVDPFVEQVVASDQASSVASNPIILLANTDHATWQQFTVVEADNQYEITALDPQTQISQLALRFENEQLVSLTLTDRQQQVSTLTFSDVQQNHSIDNQLFMFSLPEGFELDDQRAK